MKSAASLIALAVASLTSVVATPVGKRAQPKGIDVSSYQGNVNWAAQKSAGISFAYIKATEGTGYTNSYFDQQYTGSYNAGIIRGSYHFARPDVSSGATQADYFLAHGGGWSADGKTLPGALDIEYNPYGATCYGLSAANMVSWIKNFSDQYHAKTGRYPTIYTTTDWWTTCTGNSAAFSSTNALWIARYASSVGNLPAGWAYHTFWQYSSSPIDQDYFNGDAAGLVRYAKGSSLVSLTQAWLMGIQGLLPLLKSIHIHTNISAFSGKTLAVDGYVWLHRGAYACAVQLVKGQYTTKYVDYAMHRVRMMRHHGITPYIVFDGGPLPAKRGTENDREEKRAKSLALAQALEAQGRHGEAYEYYRKCVDITPQMAYQLIKALRAEAVPYVVAPYEADAQLAYLEREGIVDGIVTEDSDLVIFGCKNVLFKLGPDGSCVQVRRDDLAAVKDFNLYGWGDQELRWMAMLSGCDYIGSMQGLGLKTAHKLLRKWKTVDRVIQAIRMEGTTKVPQSYLENFRIAELAFLHQRVYDPISQRLTHLGPPPEDEEWDGSKDAFVGEDLPPEVAKMIAEGDVCPISRKAMQDIMPAFQPKLKKGKTVLKGMPSNSSVKGSASQKSISTYFSAASISSQAKKPSALSKVVSVKGSGRTSLSAQMAQTITRDDDDWEVMEIAGPSQPTPRPATASRFFATPSTPRKSRSASATTPERKRKRADSLEEISTPRASRTIVRRWSGDIVDLTEEKENEGLKAESSTGTSYSGSPDTFSLLQDLSSPIQPGSAPSRSRSRSPDWIATQVSSPVSTHKPAARPQLHCQPPGAADSGVDLDQDLPDPVPLLSFKNPITLPQTGTVENLPTQPPAKRNTTSVDLNTIFSQESVSDIGTFEEGPWTPSDPPVSTAHIAASREGARDLDDAEYISDEEEQEAVMAERQARVAEGWVSRYGFQVVKGRKSMPAIQSTQSTTVPSSTTSSASTRPIAVFQPLAMPKSRPKVKGRKSEPALTRTVLDLDDDDEEFLLGSDTGMSSPERAADRLRRLRCPV